MPFQWALKKAIWGAAALGQVAKWLWRRFPLLVAPFHPYLKWVVTGIVVASILGLPGTYVGRGIFDKKWEVEFDPLLITLRNFATHYWYIVALFVVLFVLSGLAWIGHRRHERSRLLRDAFGLYKPAEELRREDICSEGRPSFGTYYPRKAVEDDFTESDASIPEFSEENLAQYLRDGRRFLLIDARGAGKSLTLCEVLRRMSGWVVVSPSISLPLPTEKVFALLRGSKVIILLDNLATYARENYDLRLFRQRVGEATHARCGVAAACRDGSDYTLAAANSGNNVTYFAEEFLKLRLRPMADQEKKALATDAGLHLKPDELRLYRQPGDITMRDQAKVMQDRFLTLSDTTKDHLYSMKLLDTGGIPVTRTRLNAVVTYVFHRSITQDELEQSLEYLWSFGFLEQRPSGEKVDPHFGYLTWAVPYRGDSEPEDEYWDALVPALEQIQDTDALVYLANGHRQRGDLPRALGALDGALRTSPEDADAHFHRGYTLARLGRLDEALEANKRALDLRPDFAEAYNNRSYILARLGRLDEALEANKRALDLRPDFAEAHTSRAIVLARLGRFSDALEEFKAALGIRPKNYYAYLNLGITLSRQGSFKESLEAYEQALRVRPDYPEAYLNRGITLVRMGQPEEGLKEQEQAIKLRPAYAEAHMYRGRTLAGLRRYPEAIEALDRTVELQPSYALAYVNRARTFAHMGPEQHMAASKDWQTASALGALPSQRNLVLAVSLARHAAFTDALAIFDRIIDSYADFPEAYYNRGITLARMERSEEALADFAHALELRPEYAEAYYKRGITLARMERSEEALADFAHALELRPEYAEAYYQRGRTFALLGRYDAALPAFDRAIELHPGDAEAHCDRGVALANLGRQDEAIQSVDVALVLRPQVAEAYFARGFVLTTAKGYDKKRLEQALNAYDEAVRLRPEYPEAHRERGFILGQLRRDEEALVAFNQAIKLKPKYAEALFGKARTLCFLASTNSQRFPVEKSFEEALDLLERAVAVDNGIIVRITKDRVAFRDLQKDPVYGARLKALVWNRSKGHDAPGAHPTPSQPT